ncbi:hypothetical protein [Pseudomonas viridiflava]|uniref:hypothetical protein n=1 Tax=Pseudomonas viridiflava TaxID=33069 RepID=UPI003C1302C8
MDAPGRKPGKAAIIALWLPWYLVHKTPDARGRLESLASQAQFQGDLTASDEHVLAQILAIPSPSN